MRIAIYFSSISRELGGGARFESEVTHALSNRMSDRFEFVLVSHHRETRFEMPHIEIPYPNIATRKRKLAQCLGLRKPVESQAMMANRIAKENGVDLFYSPHTDAICQDVPYVVTCWDLQHRMHPFFPEVSTGNYDWNSRELHYRRVFPRAAAVVTGTEQGKNEVEHFFGVAPDRIRVIPFAVPTQMLECESVKPTWAPNNRFIIYPAQFWPHKNHATIVYALSKLKDVFGEEVTGVFPGSTDIDPSSTRAYIESLAKDLKVSIEIPGFISDNELRWLYENTDALVFASCFGPDNLPPLEAMSLGCPVVASSVRGAEEQLGDAAFLVPPMDEVAMASAIHKVVFDTPTRDGLINRGLRLAKDRSMQRYVDELLTLFEQMAKFRRCWGE